MTESWMSIVPKRVDARVELPGSKSLTNRALLVAALADGRSELLGALDSDDTRAMRDCLRTLGVEISERDGIWAVDGRDGEFARPHAMLDARASGTTARFVTAAAVLSKGECIIDGTERLRERPMRELVEALEALGGEVFATGEGGGAPVVVRPGPLAGGTITMDATRSSQFVSAVAMIGPYAAQDIRIEFLNDVLVSRSYVESTVEVMNAFGGEARLDSVLWIRAGEVYRGRSYRIEPDASAAVYPWVAAAVGGGRVTTSGISAQTSQADIRILDVLASMGATVEWDEGGTTVTVSGGQLRGVDVDLNDAPDGAMAIAVAAGFAEGTTTIRNVSNLRLKETDRLAALEAELRKLGVGATATEDGLIVVGGEPKGADIETYDDHRMAMAFSVAGLNVPGVRIADPDCVDKTWPGFFDSLAAW